jgi:hypothetical protein
MEKQKKIEKTADFSEKREGSLATASNFHQIQV